MKDRAGDDFGGPYGPDDGADGKRRGEASASASVREQRRLLDEMADADRSAWAWFPPIFVMAFTLLSFAGTYIGLRDIIATGDMRYGAFGDGLVLVLVLLATAAMVFFLRRAVMNFWSLGGAASFGAYLLLLFFSVTFGFAFYWGRLEASGQAISGATNSIEQLSDQVQTSAFALRSTAGDLTALSEEFALLAYQERTSGGTCGDGSTGGYGPRTRHRERRAQEIAARVAQIKPRFATVNGPVAILETELRKIEALSKPDALTGFEDLQPGVRQGAEPGVPETDGALADAGVDEAPAGGGLPGPNLPASNPFDSPISAKPAFDADLLARNPAAAREAQFRETRLAARRAAVEINALSSDATLAALAAEFRQWGAEYQDPGLVRRDDPQGQPYQCIQFAAGQRLQAAADRLENLPRVSAPDLPDYAGADATREAVFRMLDTVGGFFAFGRPLDALFSTDASSLTPQGEAALRSSVGAVVRDASTATPAVISPARGLKSEDRFPLAVAVIIDMLLFAFVLIEKPGRRYFDRMKKRVNDAVREEFDPLRMVALRKALEEDEDWKLLRQYRFDYDDRTFLVVPVLKNAPLSAEERAKALENGVSLERLDIKPEPMSLPDQLKTEALRDVVMLWRRNGILRRAYFKPHELQAHLRRSGQFEYADWDVLDCYEFAPSGFEQLLLSGMTAGKRIVRREEKANRRWAALTGPSSRTSGRGRDAHDRDEQRESDDAYWRDEARDARYEEAEPFELEPQPKKGWLEALNFRSRGSRRARPAPAPEPAEFEDSAGSEPLDLGGAEPPAPMDLDRLQGPEPRRSLGYRDERDEERAEAESLYPWKRPT